MEDSTPGGVVRDAHNNRRALFGPAAKVGAMGESDELREQWKAVNAQLSEWWTDWQRRLSQLGKDWAATDRRLHEWWKAWEASLRRLEEDWARIQVRLDNWQSSIEARLEALVDRKLDRRLAAAEDRLSALVVRAAREASR